MSKTSQCHYIKLHNVTIAMISLLVKLYKIKTLEICSQILCSKHVKKLEKPAWLSYTIYQT